MVGSLSGQVWLYVERGGGSDRDEHQELERSQEHRRYFFRWSGLHGDSALKNSRTSGGHRLLHPSTHTRAKYRQPHRLRGKTPKHRDTGQDTRGSMAPAASQSYGRTAGDNRRYWGGRQINEKRTERRQEEEREMHARANCL